MYNNDKSWFNVKNFIFVDDKSIRAAWEKAGNSKNDDYANLSLGNPTDIPPKVLFKEIKKLVTGNIPFGYLSYMDNAGYVETRKAIANDLVKQKLLPKGLNENHIVMVVGASGGLNCVLNALVNSGEEVVILSPYFVDFPKYVLNQRGVPKIVNLIPPRFDLDVEVIEKALNKKTKAIIINSPNNPSGRVYSKAQIDSLTDLLKRKNDEYGHPIFIISDEVYREIVYPPVKYHSPCTHYRFSIMVYSFSKSLNIPGERIGYVAIHPKMEYANTLFQLTKFANRVLGFTNAPALMQRVLPHLLPLKFNNSIYESRRYKLSKVLKEAGFEFIQPDGSFYFFVELPLEEKQFMELAQEHGLFVVSSNPFGVEGYFRIAFCVNSQTIDLACKKFLQIGDIIGKRTLGLIV